MSSVKWPMFGGLMVAWTLACGGSPAPEQSGKTPVKSEGPAPAAPAGGTGLGSATQPRSCDTRESGSGQCRQLLPTYFDPAFNMTDKLAGETCAGPGGKYLTATCPTAGVLGHCVTAVEDILYYSGAYSASSASADCTTFAQGKWTVTP